MPINVTEASPPKPKKKVQPADEEGFLFVSRKIADLKPYEKNPRQIGEEAIATMADLISEFGFRGAILVRGDQIVDGHLRYRAMQRLGRDAIPTHDVSDLTEVQVAALRIAMNRSAEMVAWDNDLLASELAEICAAGFDLALTGFGTDEIGELLAGLTAPDATGLLDGLTDAPPGPPVPKTADADAGSPADPLHVHMSLAMTADQRDEVIAHLKELRSVFGVETASQALVALIQHVKKKGLKK